MTVRTHANPEGAAMLARRTWCGSIAALLLLAALGLGGCKTARIYDIPNAFAPAADLELREEQIHRAARLQGWEAETIHPGEIVVTKRRGRHFAATTVRYSRESYSVTLRNSIDLKQRGGKIHKLYNKWVRDLKRSIDTEAVAGTYRPASSPVASPPPEATPEAPSTASSE